MTNDRDTFDVGEALGVLRREIGWVVGGVVTGILLAFAILLFAPPSFQGAATVLLRTGEAPSSLFSGSRGSGSGSGISLGGLSDLFTGASGFDTEIEILSSRSVVGEVVDSLGLQARVLRPRGVGPQDVFAAAVYDAEPMKGSYRFRRDGSGYIVSGPRVSGRAVPGVPFLLNGATVTLREHGVPTDFRIQITPREEVIERMQKRLKIGKAGGDVAELSFRSGDRATAASVPNALIAKYLERRRSTDRGINHHRFAFLAGHTDSLRTELAIAEQLLREQQERSGVFDPETHGQAEMEQALALRRELEVAEVEIRALQSLITEAAAGTLSARDVAAYPTFMANPAINQLLSRLIDAETRRTELRDRRTDADSDVVLFTRTIEDLEKQLAALSGAYLDGLTRKRSQLREELARYSTQLARLPAHAEENYRRQREVHRLSETLTALQTQLVQARLAAITEGGDVRQIDLATPPRRPEFPRPLVVFPIGLIGGLLVGAATAFGRFYLGNQVRDTRDVVLASGIPTICLKGGNPLLVAGRDSHRTLMVVSVGADDTSAIVARRIAATASLSGKNVVLADLVEEAPLPLVRAEVRASRAESEISLVNAEPPLEFGEQHDGYMVHRVSRNGSGGRDARAAVEALEERFGLVVAALPGMTNPSTAALLDRQRLVVLAARTRLTTRKQIQEASLALERLGIQIGGVVLVEHQVEDAPHA
jgi:tyrosine-protein kinase Etk/Wzc